MTPYSDTETNMVMQTRDTKIDRWEGKEWTVPVVAQKQGQTTKSSQIMKRKENEGENEGEKNE